MQSLALDITLQSYSCLLSRAAITCSYKEPFPGEECAQQSTFVAGYFSSQWRELPLLSSGSRLRGMWTQSFSGGAASAVMLALSFTQPEGYVPALSQEHQLWARAELTAYTLHQEEPSAVDQESEPCCSEVTGLTTPTVDQRVFRIYCFNFFPCWCAKNEIQMQQVCGNSSWWRFISSSDTWVTE